MLTVNTDLYKRYQFFKKHTGWCVGHSSEGALNLARAEIWAEEHEIVYTWEWDTDGDLGDHEAWCSEAARYDAGYGHYPDPQCEHEILICALWYTDKCQASLAGIIDADKNYQRVVEAELAQEAKTEAESFIYY